MVAFVVVRRHDIIEMKPPLQEAFKMLRVQSKSFEYALLDLIQNGKRMSFRVIVQHNKTALCTRDPRFPALFRVASRFREIILPDPSRRLGPSSPMGALGRMGKLIKVEILPHDPHIFVAASRDVDHSKISVFSSFSGARLIARLPRAPTPAPE